ncbi:hypothetical protein AHF37_00666 [Paragonimus kellicotti]|nr:hypothetical protein AHF37_00666 [Paragonimus kellicotti]
MENVLPMPTESDHPICSSGGGVHLLHSAVRPFEATSFPEHITQLISGVHTTCTNESVGPTTSLHATERARTGLAFAMDLIRMPNNEYVVPHCKQESGTTPTRSASRNALTCSPTVTSTPGTFSRLPTRFNLSPTVYTDPESNGTLRAEPVMDTAMPPKKLTSDDIPVLPFEATSFPEHITQLIEWCAYDLHKRVGRPHNHLHATERARTGLAFAMDLIRMPNNEYVVPHCKQESGTTPTRSASRNALTCSPTVTSTPGTFSRLPTRFNLSPTVYTDPESNGTLRAEPVMDTAMPPKKLTSDDIPVLQPPEGSFIRLTPVYGTSDKQQEVIQSLFSVAQLGAGNSACQNQAVIEHMLFKTNFVKKGVRKQPGTSTVPKNISCLYNGGQGNKKPLFLIITLERLVTGTDQTKGQCEVLGRQCIKFRSCACPKRDKENSERRTGDSTVYNTCSLSGKRRKESERTERQNKKLRVQNQEFIASTTTKATGSRQATNCSSWGSPTQEQPNHETQSNSLDGGMDTRNGDLFVDSEIGGQSTMIHFNGESYHLLLVPTGLPGGIETLSGVRFGLIRTWLHPSSRSASKQSYLLGQEVLKPEIDAEKKLTVKTNDPEESYRTTLINSRIDVDNTLHQLSIVEAQLASVLRERMLQSGQFQRIYHYGGDSTDSQPNSADAVGLGVGSIDESGNPPHEFPTVCGIGPLSSDSGISTDMVHQQQRHQQQPPAQDRLTSLGLLQQTQLINDIFPVPPAAHRSSLPISSVNINQSGAYDIDYNTRFLNPI